NVAIGDANGCSAISTNFEVVENTVPTLTINALGNTMFCDGESVTLEASGATTYIWSNGDLNNTSVITQSGVYFVTGFNSTCSGVSNEITVDVLSNSVGT